MPEIVRQAAAAARCAALLIAVFCVAACAGVSNSADSTAATTSTPTPLSSTTVSPPTTGTATLNWVAPTENTDGTPLTDLAGYTIRYGTQIDAMTQSIDVRSAETTTYEISNLAPGTYYFEVIAYTSVGTESAPSDVQSKSI